MEEEKEKKNSAHYKNILIGLIIITGLIIFNYTRPYMSGLLGAATLYVIVIGQHRYLTEKRNWKRGLSALVIVLEVLIFILLPLTGIVFLIIDTFSGVSIDPQAIMDNINSFINDLENRIGFNLFTPENLSGLPRIGTNLITSLGNSIYSFIINIVVILFVLYYMLFSNKGFETAIWEALPLKEENKAILAEETRLIIQANGVGIPLMAILQGMFAYLGYLIFGVDSPILYGILTAFASILPLVGTMIVWIPLSISLFVAGNVYPSIGLFIYGLIIIGGIDNVARFLLQKKLADIHPLITVFGVLIGIPMFGFWGVVFGPLILSLFILFFNMFRYEYIPGSTSLPRVTTKMEPVNPIIPVDKVKDNFKKNKKKPAEDEHVEKEDK
ncbi:MAG: AI-2E family transporter [Fermentimonas sp.]|jgi:predicted PurR-regulated permease PerM